jgi:Na+-translocating ferredoxin:NAD+ oxidoreductase RNF subunit RnfB
MPFIHSVRLIEDKCKGCVNCIKRCPTEAIRVRDGKASIIEEKCIDCGECVRTCPNKAKEVVADALEAIKGYKYKVALPAPAICGQFREGTSPSRVLSAFLDIGFDAVMDVAFGADLVAAKSREIISQSKAKPVISSACPAVVRLIQVRFPNLVEHIAAISSPMEVAARIARMEISAKEGIPDEDIGIFFITPCPAKVNAVKEPVGYSKSFLNGAIPISVVFPLIQQALPHGKAGVKPLLRRGSGLGVGWARAGGENQSIGADKHLSVDGIHNVIDILEDVERGKLSDIGYIEAQACVGGCVGGVLTVENSFITRRRVRILASDDSSSEETQEWIEDMRQGLELDIYGLEEDVTPRPTLRLDEDMSAAIQKLSALEKLVEELPGLDCGSCGAPNCRALAEDVVRGLASETDCVFKLREKVQLLAEELMQMAAKVPPSMVLTRKSVEQNGTEPTGEGA